MVSESSYTLQVEEGHTFAPLSLKNIKKNVQSGIVHRHLKNNVRNPTKTRYHEEKPLMEVQKC